MFEILMLLGFFYAGFCHLMPEKNHPAPPSAKQRKMNFRLKVAAGEPRPAAPHPAVGDKRPPGRIKAVPDGHLPSQRRLCKAGRLC
jgi:hypothetical protein